MRPVCTLEDDLLKDPYGRTLDQLRLSVTDRCDMRCVYCQPQEGIAPSLHREILRFEEIVAIVARLADRYGLRGIRLTGGEPLVRRGVVDLIAMLAQLPLADVALTTNAQRLAALADPLARAGLRRVNISLDSLDSERFARLTRGGDLRAVLAGLDAALAAGLTPLKLNVVLLAGETEQEAPAFVRFAADRGVEVRFLELMALGEARGWQGQWGVSAADVRSSLGSAGINLTPTPAAPGAPARRFVADLPDGRRANVGFIAAESEPFCRTCRRLRLTSTGQLLGCLMHEAGTDLRAIMRAPGGLNEAAFDAAVRAAASLKPACRPMASARPMHAVGG